jgi:hypothetical protein
MSDFNTANELAAELVWGCTYQGNETCFKPTKIAVARMGIIRRVVVRQPY